MSAAAFFGAARALKRELTGQAAIGLTQQEVDELNAVVKQWKPAASRPPSQLAVPAKFFQMVRAAFGQLEQSQVDGFNALLKAMGEARWPVAWAAYGLATAWHEVARTMQPIKERGGPIYFRRMYDIQGDRPSKARQLGNLTPGDGAKYAGRGFVQLTGRTNYEKAGEHLGVDLVGNPDLALGCDVASRILLWGMESGAFTGKGLKDYLPIDGEAGHEAFKQARRIINGQDKADKIAKEAIAFQSALAEGGWA